MSEPIEAVARVATTPSQAQVFVALLQAEGIPARVEGDSLTDEFAASRRMVNLLGTRVLVPTASLARAREILEPVAIDPEELAQQALAESLETPAPAAAPATPAAPLAPWIATGATLAAIVFAFLWRSAVEANPTIDDPVYDYVPREDGWDVRLRENGTLLHRHLDHDDDFVVDRIDSFDTAGQLATSADRLRAGRYRRIVEHRPGGTTVTWTDDDDDGHFEQGVVAGSDGMAVQTIVWQPATGRYELK